MNLRSGSDSTSDDLISDIHMGLLVSVKDNAKYKINKPV